MNIKEKRNKYMKEYSKTYLKTKNGFIRRLYTKMKSRVTGSHGGRHDKYYVGLDILPKEVFYNWILNNPTFHKMFDEYKNSGYNRMYVPTIDRIVPEKGYVLGNIQIISLSENSKRSHENRIRD